MQSKNGSLICVGTGMLMGGHITPIARDCIDKSDVVFVAVSDGVVEQWIMEMNDDVRSLQVYYQEGKSRQITYNQMVEAILTEVRLGKNVCGAFYGHPGVFAWAPHKAIELAIKEGFSGKMLPGISAEDCLYADLGIDPGRYGCFQYEASQLMFYQRKIDTAAYLILWQVGIAGDLSLSKFETDRAHRELLVDLLAEDYPREHEIILYEAATLPIHEPRIEHIKLQDLSNARVELHTTVVVPPSDDLIPNTFLTERLKQLNSNE